MELHAPAGPFSCLRRTWWDDVKENVWRGGVKGKLANQAYLCYQINCANTSTPACCQPGVVQRWLRQMMYVAENCLPPSLYLSGN